MDPESNKPIIDTGLSKLKLFSYPINLNNPQLSNEHSTLDVYIFDPDTPPTIDENVLLVNEVVINVNGLDTIQEISDRPWIRLDIDAFQRENDLFEDGDGIDIYVDGARFLPENTTITKMSVILMYQPLNGEKSAISHELQAKYCDATQYCLSPTFNFRHEYRDEKFDITSILIFRLDTIEKYSGKCQIIGYSGLNLFVLPNTHMQPSADEQKSQSDICLNEGSFQLSLFYDKPPFEKLNMTDFLTKKRVPCSTILVRIRKAVSSEDKTRVLSIADVPESEWEEKGIVVPSTAYGHSVYCTSFCEPSVPELRIYNTLNAKQDIFISNVISDNFADKVVDNNNMFDDEKEWKDFCDKIFIDNEMNFLDLDYYRTYDESIGLGVAVDGMNNLKSLHKNKNATFIAIYSFGPPATFYQEFKLNGILLCFCCFIYFHFL